MAVGGNTAATLQQMASAVTRNAIGERVHGWFDYATLWGWLDLSNSNTNGASYANNAKIIESTHVFVCDYVPLPKKVDDKRLIVNGESYDVLLVDDPMNLHKHLEIFLKYIGAVASNG